MMAGSPDSACSNHDAPSPAFQPGQPDVRVALVLAAPGRDERDAERPAAGKTGTSLDVVLRHLHAADPETFPSSSRLDYRIVNAVSTIMYGDRTVPYMWQIRMPDNLDRLRRQLDGYDVIVTFGDEALKAVRAIGREPTHHSAHPGLKGVSQLPASDDVPDPPTAQRLRLVAELLIGSRGRCSDAARQLRALRKTERVRRRALRTAAGDLPATGA